MAELTSRLEKFEATAQKHEGLIGERIQSITDAIKSGKEDTDEVNNNTRQLAEGFINKND